MALFTLHVATQNFLFFIRHLQTGYQLITRYFYYWLNLFVETESSDRLSGKDYSHVNDDCTLLKPLYIGTFIYKNVSPEGPMLPARRVYIIGSLVKLSIVVWISAPLLILIKKFVHVIQRRCVFVNMWFRFLYLITETI